MTKYQREWRLAAVIAATLVSSAGCIGAEGDDDTGEETVTATGALTASQEEALARFWAPVLYQDVNKAGGTGAGGLSDYMTRFNFDFDWNGQNNWDGVDDGFSLNPSMYFAVTESTSHYFIYYVAYHPRSWIAGTGDEHENDGEGCVLLVRKQANFPNGMLEAVMTTFHNVIHTFRNTTKLSKGIAAAPTPQNLVVEAWSGNHMRPRMFQEQGGHGFTGCTTAASCGLAGNDSIRYRVAAAGQPIFPPPNSIPNGTVVDLDYSLAPLMDLFTRRLDRPTFANASVMAGDDSDRCGEGLSLCCDNAATGIWAHAHGGVNSTLSHGLGEDPAAVFRDMFTFNAGLTPPTSDYLTNKLIHQKCEVGRAMDGSSDPCVQQICATMPSCCTGTSLTSWSALCVERVGTVCGKTCQNCTASICSEQQGPIGTGCDGKCAAAICVADPYCCNTRWDAICVNEVSTVCNLNCGSLATRSGPFCD